MRPLPVLTALALCAGCDPATICVLLSGPEAQECIEEPVTRADYFVDNSSSGAVELTATDLSDEPASLLVTTVAAGEEERIFEAIEGSGGHAMPSNFFGSFVVTAGEDVLYEGVTDEDWSSRVGEEGPEQLVLTISDP
jgi:hypothetical protein